MKWDELSKRVEMGLCESVSFPGEWVEGGWVGEEQGRLLAEKGGFLDGFDCT